MTTTLDNMKIKSEEIYAVIDDYDNISSDQFFLLTSKLNEYWKDRENLLCFFINHKEMQDMGIELEKMLSYCKFNNKEEYKNSLELVIYYTETFHHIMGISLQNLI